jgi:hypothetical protein
MFNTQALIRRINLCLILLLSIIFSNFAQTPSCNCRNVLEDLIQTTETNYPGFTFKVTATNRLHYQAFTDSLLQLATADTVPHCIQLLQSWLHYFKDKHLALVFNDKLVDKTQIIKAFSNAPKINLSKDSLLKKWQSASPNSLEGFWNMGGIYEIAIIKTGIGYHGVMMKADSVYWMPGQIKFSLTLQKPGIWAVTLANRFHNIDTFSCYIDESDQSFSLKGIRLEKIITDRNRLTMTQDSFYITQRDSHTIICRIPSFDIINKKLIDSLITSNFHILTHTRYLILDLRGNMGGFSISFEKLLPLIYTDTIRSPGVFIKSTAANIQLYEKIQTDPNLPDQVKSDIKKVISGLKKDKNGYFREPDAIYTSTVVYAQPEKVGILIDEGCSSATEMFILKAKQSKKVTLFGQRSAGIMDYSDLVGPRALCCPYLVLWCPTSRSARLPQYPIDNIGIMPDVVISYQENWINFVQQYFTKQDLTIVTSSN